MNYSAPTSEHRGRVLVIAGSDSGAGAGVQADIKTAMALGGFALTAVTTITVQNTLGVQSVHPLPANVVEAQAWSVLDDIGADVIKTGMLGDAETILAVCRIIDRTGLDSVVDPVLVAKGGSRLQDPAAIDTLKTCLIPLAGLLTPNAPEAAILTGRAVETVDDMRAAGEALLRLGCRAVLMKGGHVHGRAAVDLLMTPKNEMAFERPRLVTRHTHGTGCTLASACAVGLALGLGLEEAVRQAKAYVFEAILDAPQLGAGQGPLGHGWPLRRAAAPGGEGR